jgi:hypothetical protein
MEYQQKLELLDETQLVIEHLYELTPMIHIPLS